MAKVTKALFASFKGLEEYKGLTYLQKLFFEEFFSGKNIFLTGPAGTGKSFCVNLLFKFLDLHGIFYGKTATTGVAAINIGGTTVHSWSGMGLADDNGEDLLNKVNDNKKAKNRIKNAKVLIIDEVSMAKSELVEKLDVVCQYIRNRDKPFGGIQIIMVGDFMQLPPVFTRFEQELFAFDSRAWGDANIKTIHLTEIVRQHNEPHFARFLNEVRMGEAKDFSLLMPCLDRVFPDDGIVPVKLFCRNLDVSTFNSGELRKIKTESQFYEAVDAGGDQWKQFFDKNCQAPTRLELKVGAQVILLRNIDLALELVNGSVGVVEKVYTDCVEVRFSSGTYAVEPFTWEVKQNEYDELNGAMKKVILATRRQIPLKLAWALTIHKSQGSTLDRAEIDVSEAFAPGQAYVALSRVRNLGSLKIRGFSPNNIKTNQRCIDFYQAQQKLAEKEMKFFKEVL
jgi:ATP-dependent DNA helicase PIF1